MSFECFRGHLNVCKITLKNSEIYLKFLENRIENVQILEKV